MTINIVFVLSKTKKPLTPCSPARARKILRDGKAAVYRTVPFTIILKHDLPNAVVRPLVVKIDPGSRTTGLVIVNYDNRTLFAAELTHRGKAIKAALDSRRSLRIDRRGRKTRYRAARFNNRVRADGWLPPSLQHRVETTMTWVHRFRRWSCIEGISIERVKFDMQQMNNPDISGIEYQQGTLAGYSAREYLLEKWGRKCAYCGAEHVPLQIEHIKARANGGTNNISNLTLSCEPCNTRKGTKDIAVFLKSKPESLKRVLAQLKKPLSDAAAVNTTRNKLFLSLLQTGLPVETGTGAQTKFNRTRLNYPKAHWIDAACVGDSGATVTVNTELKPLLIKATGHGCRQMVSTDKNGFPKGSAKSSRKCKGYKTGDLVRLIQTKGKYAGIYFGRLSAIRARGDFDIATKAGRITSSFKNFTLIQSSDGYQYAY